MIIVFNSAVLVLSVTALIYFIAKLLRRYS
jgi:hypothetical protein